MCALVNELRRRGHDVLLISLTGNTAVLPMELIDVYSFDLKKSPLSFAKSFFDIYRLLKAWRPDVVHSHMFHANIFARLLRSMLRVPLVCTAHSTNEGGSIRMAIYRVTQWLSDYDTNVSVDAVNSFESKGAVRLGTMHVVPNGVDISHFHFNLKSRNEFREKWGVADDEFCFVAVGRMEPPKDYPNLLRAFAQVLTSSAKVKLFIVGDGSCRGNIENLIDELGVSSSVTLLGVRRDVKEVMCASDCLVLSSSFEGFGLVLAEAMACSRLVVTTDCGGTKQVVGDCGYVVPPMDSTALASAMLSASRLSPQSRKMQGEVGRDRVVKQFSLDAAVDKWVKIYENL